MSAIEEELSYKLALS